MPRASRLSRFALPFVLLTAAVSADPGSEARPDESSRVPDEATAAALLSTVKAPAELDVTIFAAPPLVSYPAGVAVSAAGEVFVAVDLNSSLDREPNRGRIVRLVDEDDDGRADRVDAFVESLDSPRGMCHAGDRLFVVQPPFLRSFADRDGDGKADSRSTLVRGLGFDLGFRGADHTSNGVRLGIDGWLYLAIGDYGMVDAVARDGSRLQLHGGGIVRVRPDGSRLELFARGLRNVYDVAMSPLLDGFTRDNTNDGGGWDIRLSHITPTASFGYPTLFKNFGDEVIPPLAQYGGGSGTGALFVHEPALPGELGKALYTADWGRNHVFRHPLRRSGTTFDAEQEEFLEIPRPTDLDVDARGRIFVGSWKDGMYKYAGKPIGFIARLAPAGQAAPPPPDLASLDDAAVARLVGAPGHVLRLNAQRELLEREAGDDALNVLRDIARSGTTIEARVAALFTLALLLEEGAIDELVALSKDDHLREFALRALADLGSPRTPAGPFLKALSDESARVRLQAMVGAGRLGITAAAGRLLELAATSDPVLSQAAVNAITALTAVEPCLALVGDAPDVGPGMRAAIRALREMHRPDVVTGLIDIYDAIGADADRVPIRLAIVETLIRLYHREAEWTGKWWGTRPDTRGPYYFLATWSESERIGALVERALDELGPSAAGQIVLSLRKHRVEIEAAEKRLLELARGENELRAKAVAALADARRVPDSAIPALAEAAGAAALDGDVRKRALLALLRTGDSSGLEAAFRVMTHHAGELADAREDFVRQAASPRRVDVLTKLTRSDESPPRELAYEILLRIERERGRRDRGARERAREALEKAWELTDKSESLLLAIARSGRGDMADDVIARLKHEDDDVRAAAYAAARGLELEIPGRSKPIGDAPLEDALAALEKTEGDTAIGRALFSLGRCASCHTVTKSQAPLGPYLGGIAARYNPVELATSVLRPSATIAQGFATNFFLMKSGQTHTGFVTREGSDEVEIRTGDASSVTIRLKDVRQRSTTPISVMPEGLVAELSIEELAGLLAYMRSLEDR